MEYEYIIIGCGILAVLYGAVTSKSILSLSAGNERMQEIAAAIQEGATAYLNRQYMTISLVGVVVAIILGLALSWTSAIGFVIGAVLSGAAGYIGMVISVRANVRTTEASRESLAAGLSVSFKSGAVTGMLVAGLALLGQGPKSGSSHLGSGHAGMPGSPQSSGLLGGWPEPSQEMSGMLMVRVLPAWSTISSR